MKRPTTLYRFNGHKELEKHRIQRSCAPYIEVDSFNNQIQADLWRCRCDGDHKGYAMRRDAKIEEIRNTKSRIIADEAWLKTLTKDLEKV